MKIKIKKNKHTLKKLINKLIKHQKNKNFYYGHFPDEEWAHFGINDLDNLKANHIIKGQWKIVDDSTMPQHKSIYITHFQTTGDLKKFYYQEIARIIKEWIKLNLRWIISGALFTIIIIVVLVYGITSHGFQ